MRDRSTRSLLIARATTLLTFFVGLWLFFAPFAIGYQKIGAHWTEATTNSMWIGAGLVFFSSLTLILHGSFALHDAAQAAQARVEAGGEDGGEQTERS